MAYDQSTTIRRISWHELFPWLILFRTFRISMHLPILTLALAGVVLVPLGWRALGLAFPVKGDRDFQRITARHEEIPAKVYHVAVPAVRRNPHAAWLSMFRTPGILYAVYVRTVGPFYQATWTDLNLAQRSYLAVGAAWTLLVWAVLGGAITRMAVVELGVEERIGMSSAIKFTRRRLKSYLIAPLLPLLVMLLLAIPIMLLGVMMRWEVGAVIGGLLWIFALLVGLLITRLLVGVAFGWPLMWPAISAEEHGDVFEAFSRSYSYVYQRPLRYLFYAIVAGLLGALCWEVVFYFADTVIGVCHYLASVGAGSRDIGADLVARNSSGTIFIRFGDGFVRSIAVAIVYSFFWCNASAIYLLLRRDQDLTKVSDLYLEDADDRHKLPKLDTNAN